MKEVQLHDTIRFVARYWRRTPGGVALIVGGICSAVLFDIALPSVARHLTEAVQANDRRGAMTAVALFIGCGASFSLSWQLGYRALCRLTVRHMKDLMHETFATVQHASADWHANTFAGSTVSKLSRGMRAFDLFSDTVMAGIVPTTVLVVGSLAMIAVQWPLMGLCASLSVSLYIGVAATMSRYYISPSNRQAARMDTRLTADLADALTCNATVKAFGAEASEERRLQATLQNWGKDTLTSWMRRQNMYGVMACLSLLNQLALLGTPVFLWSRGQAGAAEVAYAITVFFLLNGNIKNVVNIVQNLQRATNDLEDVVLLSRMALDVKDAADAVPAQLKQGEVRFNRVTFRYAGQDTPLYRDLSVTIRPGETVGLVGASGSGKTTFVKLLQRLYDVEAGQVLVDGQDIRSLTQSSLRRHIALVPQEPALFHRSLAENIRYARPDATLDEVMDAARQAHAHHFITRLPMGYDTLVGERGIKLSGGERQRVAIARALLSEAPVLVLDEATSSLDSVSERLIQTALDRLMTGRTTLIVAHRLSTLCAVDRILVFDQGCIVEDGTHQTLLQKEGGRYRQLYETQQLGVVEAVADLVD